MEHMLWQKFVHDPWRSRLLEALQGDEPLVEWSNWHD
jgi:hypothetical protein